MSMFFGMSGVDVFCCLICNTPPQAADFAGGWWGLSTWSGGCYATRLPSFVTDPSHVEFDSLGRYVWRVRHATDSVLIPDVTQGGVTYRCVGSPGSQYADGSWFAPAKASIVVYQLHFAPLDDLATTTPRAGLAFVRVADTSVSGQEISPPHRECTLLGAWLINDEEGDPKQWNNAVEHCHYYDNWDENDGLARKTLVGPEHFALQTRRMSGGTEDKIVYWALNQATPTAITYNNAERGTDGDWTPLFFCSFAFPWALWARVKYGDGETEYWPSGRLKRLIRQYRLAKAVLPTLAVDDSDVVANNLVFPDALFYGEDDPDFAITESDTHVYFLDCEIMGMFRPSVTVGTPPTTATLWMNAATESYDDQVAPKGGAFNLDSDPEPPLTGTNYKVGCVAIAVSRYTNLNFGFTRTAATPTKPAWRLNTPLSAGAGEWGVNAFAGLDVDDSDDIVYRANNRTVFRIFARRNNGWYTDDSYWSPGAIWHFQGTTEGGILTNPGSDAPLNSIPAVVRGNETVVQVASEGYTHRPTYDPFEGVKYHEPAIAIVNWTPVIDDPPTTWLDYVVNDAWFWRGADVLAPLWRETAEGLVANNVGTSGWYYSGTGTVIQGGVFAYDGSIDELTETMGDSVPP